MYNAGRKDVTTSREKDSLEAASSTKATTTRKKKLGFLIIPMLEISRDAIFRKEKAPAGCSLLNQGL